MQNKRLLSVFIKKTVIKRNSKKSQVFFVSSTTICNQNVKLILRLKKRTFFPCNFESTCKKICRYQKNATLPVAMHGNCIISFFDKMFFFYIYEDTPKSMPKQKKSLKKRWHHLNKVYEIGMTRVLYRLSWGGFSCLKDRMLEKLQPIKIAKRFYWLNAFLKKIEVDVNRKCIKSVENNQKYYKLRFTTAILFR